jgi:hypothetical protein
MFDFQVDGERARYGRVVGRLAYLSPKDGDLLIRYRFRGLPWANAVSVAAWLAFLGLGLAWAHRELRGPRGGQGLGTIPSWITVVPGLGAALLGQLLRVEPE